jgi:hypothetical protein
MLWPLAVVSIVFASAWERVDDVAAAGDIITPTFLDW